MVFRSIFQIGGNLVRTFCQSAPKSTKCFSRKGDSGLTETLSGEVLSKDNYIFDAIGATEELCSYLGLARVYASESDHDYSDKLRRIQTILIELYMAISKATKTKSQPFEIGHTKELEDWILEYTQLLSLPEHFIVPGGGQTSATLQIARAICRRAERNTVKLVNEGKLDKEAQVYLNRLSDFLFVVARVACKEDQRTETIYVPKPDLNV